MNIVGQCKFLAVVEILITTDVLAYRPLQLIQNKQTNTVSLYQLKNACTLINVIINFGIVLCNTY